jgi:endonuclease/exonuclease/phosphatase family metal-dependent hydrolase
MSVSCVSYNIQYGFGIDGTYDLPRVCDAVRNADIILLQEVTRGFLRNGGTDMVAGIRELLPERYAVAGMPADIDFGSALVDGTVRDQRFQFGNMVLSRWPILSSRLHLLPRSMRLNRLNLQRGALESLITTPAGIIRFFSIHLDHVDVAERLRQIETLRAIMISGGHDGGAATGLGEFGFPELPLTDHALAAGDFNMRPGSPEYCSATGTGSNRLHDVSPPAHVMSFFNPAQAQDALQRLDYAFATPALAGRVAKSWIDEEATGSDHRPLWFEID